MTTVLFAFTFACCSICLAALELDKSATIPSLYTHTQPGLPGGKSPANLSDKEKSKEIRELAERALLQLESNSNDTHGSHRVIRIKEATSQVVAGFSYEIVFYVGECGNSTEGNFTIDNETLTNHSSKTHRNNSLVLHQYFIRILKDEKPVKSLPHELPIRASATHSRNKTAEENHGGENSPCKGNCTVTKPPSPPGNHCSINESGTFAICYVKILDQQWTNTFKVKPSACKEVTKQEVYSSFEN